MPNIVFIHGTGVRQPSYDNSFQLIEQQSKKKWRNSSLYPCYWGGTEGSVLRYSGASIPDFDTARAVGEVDAKDLAVEEWRLLYEDPDCEMEALLGQPAVARPFNPAEETPFEAITSLLQRQSEKTRALERELGVADVWPKAKAQLLAALTAAAKAKRTIPEPDSQIRAVLARALVAHAINLAFAVPDDNREWPAGMERDALVRALCEDWGGEDRSIASGVFGWIGNRVKRLALKIGTDKVARKRGVISDAAYPATGDILLYQARGCGIRDFIETAIQNVPKPCVLLAHSLGGIACVDLLAHKKIDGVTMLITAGSQAPLLYELNALAKLPYGTPLPASFPAWLNIYDKHDFLSYIGAKVFSSRVTDVLVDNGQPFPEAHSAYWKNPEVWTAIARSLS
jgi:hypothetical protein